MITLPRRMVIVGQPLSSLPSHNGPSRGAVDHFRRDSPGPVEIHDDEVRVRTNADGALLGIDSEYASGTFTTDLHEPLEANATLVHALRQQNRQQGFHARGKSAARFPHVPLVHFRPRHAPIHVVRADTVDLAVSQTVPQNSHGFFIAERNVYLPHVMRQRQIVVPCLTVDLDPLRPRLVDLVQGLPGRRVHDVERATGHTGIVGIRSHVTRLAEMRGPFVPGRHIGASGSLETFFEESNDLVVLGMNANDAGRPKLGGLLHAQVHGTVVKAQMPAPFPSGPHAVGVRPLHRVEVILERGHAKLPGHAWNIEGLSVRRNESGQKTIDERIGLQDSDELRHHFGVRHHVLGPGFVDIFLPQLRARLHDPPGRHPARCGGAGLAVETVLQRPVRADVAFGVDDTR